MRLTPSQLATVREKPQNTRLDLVIYNPREVMRGRVSSSTIHKNSYIIPFDGASPTGTVPTFVNGMTVLVSNTDYGQDDWGRVRLRSASVNGGISGSFTVSENSNILWQDDLYLTVIDYQDIVPIFPRIIQNPSNVEDVIFYKDYDVVYSTQNRYLGTIINMGGHRARTLENGTAQIYWSASGTNNLDSNTDLMYRWNFGGGTPTGSYSETPGLVTYNGAGDYVTSLTVIASGTNQTTDTSYRYVSIRDKIGYGNNTPIVRWEVSNFGGSRSEAGYSADFTVWDNMNIQGNSLVMLVSDDWYGSTHQSLGGNTYNEPYMFFVGYIDKGSIKYDYKQSKVTFTALSVTGIMKEADGFSVSVESKASPSTWYELYEMDCKRAIYHYLRWHTTILNTVDYIFNGDDKYIQFFDSDRTSMFDAVDELMRTALVGTVCSDRQGRLYAEIEPRAYDDPTGSFGNYVMDITRRDWINEPEIDERINGDISYMERGGVKFKGITTNTFQALLACAPGRTPGFRGGVEKEQGLALKSQTQLNKLVGHLYANANSRFPRVAIDMSENARNLDIAPYETVDITIQQNETVRNKYIHGLYIPDGMTWHYNHKDGLHLPFIEYKELVNGFPGDTITIPPVDTGSPEFERIDFTPLALPPLLPFASGTFPADVDPTTVVLGTTDRGVLYTTNFDEVAPVWQTMNEGLPYTTGTFANLGIGDIVVCGNKSLFMMCNGNPTNGYQNIYYAPAVGEPWQLVMEYTDTQRFKALASNPTASEQVAALGGYASSANQGYLLVGNSGGLTIAAANHAKKSNSYSALKFGNGGWHLIISDTCAGIGCSLNQSLYTIHTEAGTETVAYFSTTVPPFPTFGGFATECMSTIGRDSGKIYMWVNSASTNLTISGTTFTTSSNLTNAGNTFQLAAASPSGDRLLGASYSGGNYLAYRSSDAGATWELATAVIPLMNKIFENCGDEKRWIFGGGGGFAGGAQVKYTSNFAEPGFNENKEGNLHPDFTGVALTHIRFVE